MNSMSGESSINSTGGDELNSSELSTYARRIRTVYFLCLIPLAYASLNFSRDGSIHDAAVFLIICGFYFFGGAIAILIAFSALTLLFPSAFAIFKKRIIYNKFFLLFAIISFLISSIFFATIIWVDRFIDNKERLAYNLKCEEQAADYINKDVYPSEDFFDFCNIIHYNN